MTTFSIVISDPNDLESASQEALIKADAQAAAELWASHIFGRGNIQVQINIDSALGSNNELAQGGSANLNYENTVGGIEIYAQSTKTVILTGIHPNGTPPDAFIEVSPASLSFMFLDPDPTARTATVPANKVDAVSVFTHEIGHALGFNGWRSGTDGSLSTFDTVRNLPYESDFDSFVAFTNGNLYFTGANAEAAYGGPVPLEYGDYGHVGNRSPRPGSDLTSDLMYGTAANGARSYISALDLAVLSDTGLPVSTVNDFVVHNFGTNTTVTTANGITTVDYALATAGVHVDLSTGIATDGSGGTDQLVGIRHVNGSNFGDIINGSAQTNVFSDGAGANTINGQGGHDILVFAGNRSAYSIANVSPGVIKVTDSIAGRDGTDTVANIEHLLFADKTVFVEDAGNASVALLYSAALDRAPDATGLNGWEDIYAASGVSAITNPFVALAETSGGYNGALSIAAGFTNSTEFRQKYGTLDDTGFVTQMYANVLHRTPDAAGLNGWLTFMHSGDPNGVVYTREMVLVGFAESTENTAKVTADWLFTV